MFMEAFSMGPKKGVCTLMPRLLSASYRKSLIRLLRTGFLSFLSAFASICRIRSRVTLNSLPTSSSVRGCPSSRPKRSTITWRSLSFKSPSNASICSRSITDSTFPSGVTTLLSATKSPKLESSSSPIGVSREAGSLAICMISITLSSDISSASASSVTDGS